MCVVSSVGIFLFNSTVHLHVQVTIKKLSAYLANHRGHIYDSNYILWCISPTQFIFRGRKGFSL